MMSSEATISDARSALLRYVDGELSADERAVLERRLATDEGLRATRDELRAADASVRQWLAASDEQAPLSVSADKGARRFASVVRA